MFASRQGKWQTIERYLDTHVRDAKHKAKQAKLNEGVPTLNKFFAK
eukprot:gene5298-2187_t